MSKFENKVDFVVFVSVTNANPNGDPLNGNRPRTDYNGFGEISDVCIKRKIRNRMQDMGECIFVQSDDRANDGAISLKKRADVLKDIEKPDAFSAAACEKWIDVRSFGQVFTFKGFKCTSLGVRGPVSIHQAVSMDPVDINSMQITKSVSNDRKKGERPEEKDESRGKDTMGKKHLVRFGLYEIKGSINVQLAEKTGFTAEDAALLKECLRTLFVNDASAARPDGSMEVVQMYWWQHDCKEGQYSSAKVHRSVHAHLKDGVIAPTCVDDYVITADTLEGLAPEVLYGV